MSLKGILGGIDVDLVTRRGLGIFRALLGNDF